MSDLVEALERLEKNMADYDAEAAYELANEGERADLWTEIDVNVDDLRIVLSALRDTQEPGADAVATPCSLSMSNGVITAAYNRDEDAARAYDLLESGFAALSASTEKEAEG